MIPVGIQANSARIVNTFFISRSLFEHFTRTGGIKHLKNGVQPVIKEPT